jgi:hypothetical protein
MLAHAPSHDLPVYSAIYMTVGGARTLATSACAMFESPVAYLYIASAFVSLALYGLAIPASSRLRLGMLLFVAFLPMTVLTIAAIDYGRWLSLAVLNWWLIAAALQLKNVDPLAIERWPSRTSMVAGAALLALGPGSFVAANTVTKTLGARLRPTPAASPWDRCDPTWRSVASPAAQPSS